MLSCQCQISNSIVILQILINKIWFIIDFIDEDKTILTMILLAVLKLSFLIVSVSSSQGSFQTFKFLMQEKVKSISNAIQRIYATKCDNQLIRNCTVPSFDSCRGTDKRQCINNLPKSDQCPGSGFYSKKSVVRMPSWITPLNLSEQTKQFICSSAQQQFQSVLLKIQNQNDQEYSWGYFGSNDGSFRFSPGFKYPQSSPGICLDYDPRLRPWYAQNAYNRKNIILVAQTSSSMSLNGGSRFNGMVLALNALIRTFDSDDFLNIIEFNSKSRSTLNLSYLIPVSGNLNQRKIFFDAVANLTTSPKSSIDFQEALLYALNIINESITGNQQRNDCKENIILLFADGNPNCGQKNATNLKRIIDNYSQQISPNLPLTIFTFNLNKEIVNINNSVMAQLSCFYGGMHFNIPQIVYQSQFITAVQGYFQFLSYGNQVTQPSWSEIYTDAAGLGQMTTVVLPAYFIDGSIKRLLGVAGIDVLVSQFKIYEPDLKKIQLRLSTDGLCFTKKIGGCQLQLIRDTKCNMNCSFSNSEGKNLNSSYFCQKKIRNSTRIFQDPLDSTDKDCCHSQVSGSNSVLIGSVVAASGIVLLLIAVFCYWRYMKSINLSYQDLKKFQDFDISRIRTEQEISPIHD